MSYERLSRWMVVGPASRLLVRYWETNPPEKRGLVRQVGAGSFDNGLTSGERRYPREDFDQLLRHFFRPEALGQALVAEVDAIPVLNFATHPG